MTTTERATPASTSTAYARRISADLYEVTYSDAASLDTEVTDAYLEMLRTKGYRVEIQHSNYRGATTGDDVEVRNPTPTARSRLAYRHGK
jgi:hypothetical protein